MWSWKRGWQRCWWLTAPCRGGRHPTTSPGGGEEAKSTSSRRSRSWIKSENQRTHLSSWWICELAAVEIISHLKKKLSKSCVLQSRGTVSFKDCHGSSTSTLREKKTFDRIQEYLLITQESWMILMGERMSLIWKTSFSWRRARMMMMTGRTRMMMMWGGWAWSENQLLLGPWENRLALVSKLSFTQESRVKRRALLSCLSWNNDYYRTASQPGRRRGRSWWRGGSWGRIGGSWGRVRGSASRRPPSSTPPTAGLCLHLDSGNANVTVRQKYRSSMIQDKPDRKRELGGRWGERNEACLLVFTPWKVDIIQAFGFEEMFFCAIGISFLHVSPQELNFWHFARSWEVTHTGRWTSAQR